jgi:Ca-activated chloride channel family protein
MRKTVFIVFTVIMFATSFYFIYHTRAQSDGCRSEITSDPYTRDDDFDGYPDFLETGAGYKINSDDCLDKMKCGKISDLEKIGERKNILIILDASGSMSASTPSGKSRMDVAKEAIASYLDILPPDASVGLVAYSAKGFRGDSCSQIQVVSDIQKLNKTRLTTAVNALKESGLTPMAASVKFTAKIFEKYPEDDNHIILISDGEESCSGNPIQEVYDIRSGKGRPRVDVIGLCVSGNTAKQLKCMAEVAAGRYHSAENAEDLKKAMEESFTSSRDFIKMLVCLQRDFNAYMLCENTKFNKLDQWLIRKNVMADDDMKVKLAAAREAIVKKNKQVEKLSLEKLQQKAQKLEKDTQILK